VPEAAVITLLPCAFEVASPDEPITATAGVAEVQVTVLVRSFVLESEYVPFALNCAVKPAATEDLSDVTAMEVSVGVTGGGGVPDVPPPEHAAKLRTINAEHRTEPKRSQAEQKVFMLCNPSFVGFASLYTRGQTPVQESGRLFKTAALGMGAAARKRILRIRHRPQLLDRTIS
jgi:hypothetical protein